jgi:hypothetical protein
VALKKKNVANGSRSGMVDKKTIRAKKGRHRLVPLWVRWVTKKISTRRIKLQKCKFPRVANGSSTVQSRRLAGVYPSLVVVVVVVLA